MLTALTKGLQMTCRTHSFSFTFPPTPPRKSPAEVKLKFNPGMFEICCIGGMVARSSFHNAQPPPLRSSWDADRGGFGSMLNEFREFPSFNTGQHWTTFGSSEKASDFFTHPQILLWIFHHSSQRPTRPRWIWIKVKWNHKKINITNLPHIRESYDTGDVEIMKQKILLELLEGFF